MSKKNRTNIIISIIQTILMIIGVWGAIYFGKKQNEVNDRLTQIEKHNYEQKLLNEEVQLLKEKKQLRNITTEIIEIFSWRNQYERDKIQKRTRKENLELIRKIDNLLYEGLDNRLLVGNKQALSKWLQAINYIEMYKHISYDDIIVGKKTDKYGTKPDNSANENFDKLMVNDMNNVFTNILQIHSKLGLSLSKMSRELSKELKNQNSD